MVVIREQFILLNTFLPPTVRELDVEVVYTQGKGRPGNAPRPGKTRGNGVRINRNTRK